MLHKNFAYIRGFIEDVFGKDTEIAFNKIDPKDLPRHDEPLLDSTDSNNSNDSGSMIEDIEVGSGCVATMGATSDPTPAQKEMTITDVLNSNMVQKAIELFQPETQIRVKSKL